MSDIVRFDCFEADLAAGELRKRGTKLKLRNQSFQVLAILLKNPGKVVSRNYLREQLWHNDVFVDFDNNLNIIVARLREELGDSADRPRFIETLPKRGYRFVGEVSDKIGEELQKSNETKITTRDIVAYNEYLRGRISTFADFGNFEMARQHFEKALERDPDFAPAQDALAELYWELGYLGVMAPRKAFSVGLAYALRALEIDSTRAETHALVAQFHKTVEYNWAEVHREMEIARRLDPNSALVRTRYAISELVPHGRLDEAILELEAALETDLMSIWACGWLAIVLLLHGDYERAIQQSSKLLEFNPKYTWGHFVQGASYLYQRKIEAAVAAHRRAVKCSGDLPCTIGWLGLTLASIGESSEARILLRQLLERREQAYVPATSIAWIHLGLGEVDSAFAWIDRAVAECDAFILPIKSYRFLDPIRSDRRFGKIVQKMNLNP
jgi:DNA-binding winged helix-turn-helix (wHTH) protein/Flp pilus assembly protein TadD